MEVLLSDGTKMRCDDRSFKQGGEGEVYFSEGKTHVIKLYIHQDPHRRATLENIVNKYNLVKDDPERAQYFGWPDAIVTSPRLGIRMPMVKGCRPLDEYVRFKFWKLCLPASERGSWQTRLSITFRMARILRWMHGRGLCHSDLSPKNFLVNVKTAQTTLIDCDGLVVPGVQPPGVLGTPQCMAPEIVMGKATPSVNTDKHALAVLIYWTFLFSHPLLGPKIHAQDPEIDENLAYGANALYIEHPTDHSNRPKVLPPTSDILTPLIKRLFNRAFIEGLKDPFKRPSAADWESALQRMADRIVPCQNSSCEMHAFVVPDKHQFKCPWCGTPYRSSAGMPIITLYRPGNIKGSYAPDDWSIAVYPKRPIFAYHSDSQKGPEQGAQPAMIAHFELDNKGKWYLQNDGIDDMRVLVDGGSSLIKRNTNVEITRGMKILLGGDEKHRLAFVQMLTTS